MSSKKGKWIGRGEERPKAGKALSGHCELRVKTPFAVTFLNRKGGVGKTSSVHHLGGAYAKNGNRVLLLDMDPQQSLTQGLLGARTALSLTAGETLAGLFDDRLNPDPEKIIRPTAFPGMFLAPSSTALNRYDHPDPLSQGRVVFALREFLDEVQGRFDIILMDCRPTLNLLSFSTLLAADGIVVPLQPEDYGSQGIAHVLQQVNIAQEKYNPRLRLIGYLLTMTRKRLGIHAAYSRQLRTHYGDDLFTATIPDLKDYKEAITLQQPVCYYKPRSAAAAAVEVVACELLRRVKERSRAAENNQTAKEEVV